MREQLLSLLLLWSVLGGLYIGLRYVPAARDMVSSTEEIQKISTELSQLEIPAEPTDRAENVAQEIAELKILVQEAQDNNIDIEGRLAPEDLTEVRMAVAEVARQSRVRIQDNVAFTVDLPATAASTTGAASSGTTAPAPEKPVLVQKTRAQRKADRAIRREEERLMKSNSAMVANSIALDKASPLMVKLGSDAVLKRPLQRISMRGSYAAIRQFISALDDMDWLVTVVQIEIQASVRKPQPGMAQQLDVFMIMAL